MGYTSSTLRGITWLSSFRAITRILSFVKIAVLARVLTPTQFGVFGIASLVLSLLEILTETGINIVLIQTKKEIDGYINSAWVVSIIRGFIVSALILLSAPFIASFFNSPSSLNIILFISLVPLIRGFINPAVIKFRKDLNFNYEFWFRTTLFLVDAAVSVVAALLTNSVYSLIYGLLAGAVLEVILSFILIKPRPIFKIEKKYFDEIFHKGKWVTAYGIFNYLAGNLDNIGVGKILGSSSLGIYQVAYKISILPISEVSDVVSQVVFPVYMKIGEDINRVRTAFVKTIILMFVGSLLVGGVIFFFPTLLITTILGSQWLSAVPVLKVLSLYGILRTLGGPSSAFFLARGKQNYVTVITLIRCLVILFTIYPLVNSFGILGAGYSALLSVVVEIPVIIFLLYRVFTRSK